GRHMERICAHGARGLFLIVVFSGLGCVPLESRSATSDLAASPVCSVEFVITGAGFTSWREDIWIVGDRPELGPWTPSNGRQTDDWLAANLPPIHGSEAVRQGGAVFITWDEGEGGDG